MRWPANGRPEIRKSGARYIVRAYNPAHHRVQAFRTRCRADAYDYLALCLRDWAARNARAL